MTSQEVQSMETCNVGKEVLGALPQVALHKENDGCLEIATQVPKSKKVSDKWQENKGERELWIPLLPGKEERSITN